MKPKFTKNELIDARTLAEDLSTYGHPETLCEKASYLMLRMLEELEREKEDHEQV